MDSLNQILSNFNALIWGLPLLSLLMGTGIYLTVLLRGMQFSYLTYAVKQVFMEQKGDAEGDISHFQALMASLAGALGTGTIVGVATAIAIGGLGSMFWMWVTAILGMATKYAESLLAVKFRVSDEKGEMMGGPMQYMERGLGWKKSAMLFAFLGALAAIGTGNLLQANAITEVIVNVWNVDSLFIAILLSITVGVVLLGGVKALGQVASILVPFMALFYFVAGLLIILMNIDQVPGVIATIFVSAFSGHAAFGGFAGSTVMMAMQMGVTRGVVSTEAGLGISSMAAATAKTDSPGRQGMITMAGGLISTMIVCSVTALVLGVTKVLGKTDAMGVPLNGASMVVEAFSSSILGGGYIVAVGLILFAFTTIIAWGYYGEKCCEYLFGEHATLLYRGLFTLLIIPGAIMKLETAWYCADIFNGLMAIPNLIALIALSGVIVSETRAFLQSAEEEKRQEALCRHNL